MAKVTRGIEPATLAQSPCDTVLKRYRMAAGIDQPLRYPSPYATPLPTRPLSLRDPSSPSPPLMHQHATSPPRRHSCINMQPQVMGH